MSKVSISICTPAYKRVDFLKRLIESIILQTYRDFEFIITDDSNDDSVLQLVNSYADRINIQYYKNEKALGTPGNMNYAMDKAKGEWIKVMHDDDWFASPNSLSLFAEQIKKKHKFVFSAYNNCSEESGSIKKITLPAIAKQRVIKYPLTLMAKNVIGPPSVTMLHCSIRERYDERMKWRVDQEFYMRLLMAEKSYSYIEEVLVNVGVSDSQVTNLCKDVPSVELPEGYLLLEKYGTKPLRNIMVFDAWWRILRNTNTRTKEQLERFGQKDWPAVILSIVHFQSFIPNKVLKIGIVSKFAMACSYCTNYLKSNF